MSTGSTRLDAAEIERRLESLVFLVLNSRRSVAPAATEVAAFPLEAQGRFLAAVEHIARQPFGDDVDIDAVVQAWTDRRVGLEGTDRLFSRRSREERDTARRASRW